MPIRILASFLIVVALFGACSSDKFDSVAIPMQDGHEFGLVLAGGPSGTTWVFSNESDEAHTVTLYQDSLPEGAEYWTSGGFDSEEEARANVADGLIAPGEEFSVTIDEPGEYRYFCIPHEADGMKGTLEVQE